MYKPNMKDDVKHPTDFSGTTSVSDQASSTWSWLVQEECDQLVLPEKQQHTCLEVNSGKCTLFQKIIS